MFDVVAKLRQSTSKKEKGAKTDLLSTSNAAGFELHTATEQFRNLHINHAFSQRFARDWIMAICYNKVEDQSSFIAT